MSKDQITMYGADWCGDCRRSERLLNELNVEYTKIDTDADVTAADKVIEINGGAKSIPVIVFSDGTHLTEPSDNDLKAKLQSLGIIQSQLYTAAEESAAESTTIGKGALSKSAMIATVRPTNRWSIISCDFSEKLCTATKALSNAIGIKALIF